MLKTMKRKVRVVWVFRKTNYVALLSTDLSLTVEQTIEYYGARWKIEAGFKEIKQEIGSAKSLTRNAHAVLNHLNFCMMAATLTWIYADRLQCEPDRRHKILGRASFAFSDVIRIIAEEAEPGFSIDLPQSRTKPAKIFCRNASADGGLRGTDLGNENSQGTSVKKLKIVGIHLTQPPTRCSG